MKNAAATLSELRFREMDPFSQGCQGSSGLELANAFSVILPIGRLKSGYQFNFLAKPLQYSGFRILTPDL